MKKKENRLYCKLLDEILKEKKTKTKEKRIEKIVFVKYVNSILQKFASTPPVLLIESDFVLACAPFGSTRFIQCFNQLKINKRHSNSLYLYFFFSCLIYSLNKDKVTMRDNRGVNRMVEVLNSGIETGNSSNLIPKSSMSVDASVLKERNTNDSTSDSTKAHAIDTIKESKGNDSRESKLNAQCGASDSNIRQHCTSQRTSNDLMMNLDLEEIDYDDDEKCAKTLTSEGENDSQNTLMDVDEPNENLYVTANASKQYDQPKEKCNDKNADDTVAIDSEEESNKKNEQEHDSSVVVNGINKYGSSTNDLDKDNTKSVDNTVKATTSKAMKRKVSISSDDDQQPPAKK